MRPGRCSAVSVMSASGRVSARFALSWFWACDSGATAPHGGGEPPGARPARLERGDRPTARAPWGRMGGRGGRRGAGRAGGRAGWKAGGGGGDLRTFPRVLGSGMRARQRPHGATARTAGARRARTGARQKLQAQDELQAPGLGRSPPERPELNNQTPDRQDPAGRKLEMGGKVEVEKEACGCTKPGLGGPGAGYKRGARLSDSGNDEPHAQPAERRTAATRQQRGSAAGSAQGSRSNSGQRPPHRAAPRGSGGRSGGRRPQVQAGAARALSFARDVPAGRAGVRTAASGHHTEPPREVRAGVRVGGGHRCRPARRVLFLLHATCRPVGRMFGAGFAGQVGQVVRLVDGGVCWWCVAGVASGQARGWSGVAWAWWWWCVGVCVVCGWPAGGV